jgi:hypothetical protein
VYTDVGLLIRFLMNDLDGVADPLDNTGDEEDDNSPPNPYKPLVTALHDIENPVFSATVACDLALRELDGPATSSAPLPDPLPVPTRDVRARSLDSAPGARRRALESALESERAFLAPSTLRFEALLFQLVVVHSKLVEVEPPLDPHTPLRDRARIVSEALLAAGIRTPYQSPPPSPAAEPMVPRAPVRHPPPSPSDDTDMFS